jgi:4-hydroxy-tetrahydrodipicolinate synthase
MNLDGVLVPIVTPFDRAGELNLEALDRIVDLQVEAAVKGIIACGTTGEYYTLTPEERETLMRRVAGRVGDRALRIAGINDLNTAACVRHAEQARGMGYQALMMSPPAYSLPEQHELVAHFRAVAQATELPLIMYNFPARAGVEIGLDAVIELSREPNIIGIKESSGDFSRALALLTTDFEDFQVICGCDDQAADFLWWGARSWISGSANVFPEEQVWMIDAAVAEDFGAVRELMQRMLPAIRDMEAGAYNQKAKLGVAHRLGVDVGNVRPPLLPLSEVDRTRFLATLDASAGAR